MTATEKTSYDKAEPICVQDRRDCNRYNEGFCALLTDTRFNKACPFYKKEEKKNGSKT